MWDWTLFVFLCIFKCWHKHRDSDWLPVSYNECAATLGSEAAHTVQLAYSHKQPATLSTKEKVQWKSPANNIFSVKMRFQDCYIVWIYICVCVCASTTQQARVKSTTAVFSPSTGMSCTPRQNVTPLSCISFISPSVTHCSRLVFFFLHQKGFIPSSISCWYTKPC